MFGHTTLGGSRSYQGMSGHHEAMTVRSLTAPDVSDFRIDSWTRKWERNFGEPRVFSNGEVIDIAGKRFRCARSHAYRAGPK